MWLFKIMIWITERYSFFLLLPGDIHFMKLYGRYFYLSHFFFLAGMGGGAATCHDFNSRLKVYFVFVLKIILKCRIYILM